MIDVHLSLQMADAAQHESVADPVKSLKDIIHAAALEHYGPARRCFVRVFANEPGDGVRGDRADFIDVLTTEFHYPEGELRQRLVEWDSFDRPFAAVHWQTDSARN